MAFDGKRAKPGWHFVRLGMPTMAVTVSAPAVSAQDDGVAGLLTAGVRCFESNAKDGLGDNIKKLNVAHEMLGAPLNHVAADTAQYSPIRKAAAEIVRRAGAMKFEVGLPPRNMTRDRSFISGLGY